MYGWSVAPDLLPNFPAFRNLQSLSLTHVQLEDNFNGWRNHIVRILGLSPDLRDLELSQAQITS